MKTKWIGREINTCGLYNTIGMHKELSKRTSAPPTAPKLYKFETRLGGEYYISDWEVINKLETLIDNDDNVALYDYLFGLIVTHFGVMELVKNAENKMVEQYDKGVEKGFKKAQKKFRKAIGL